MAPLRGGAELVEEALGIRSHRRGGIEREHRAEVRDGAPAVAVPAMSNTPVEKRSRLTRLDQDGAIIILHGAVILAGIAQYIGPAHQRDRAVGGYLDGVREFLEGA